MNTQIKVVSGLLVVNDRVTFRLDGFTVKVYNELVQIKSICDDSEFEVDYRSADVAGATFFTTPQALLIAIAALSVQTPGGQEAITSADISDATAVGKSVITAANAAAARTAIGAGTGNSNVAVATTAPLAPATTAAVGTSSAAARADHVHPLQASVATLTTGRTFSLSGGATGTSAAFNGSANATIAVTLAVPTATVRGGVLQQTTQANSAAADVAALVADFNTLLGKLKAAGVIAS